MPWLMAVRVVSLPATARRMKNGATSSGASISPSTSACTSLLVRSSVGFLRRVVGELVHQLGELQTRTEDRGHRVAVADEFGVTAAEDDVRRVQHGVELAARDAHHVADDEQRERLDECLDEVDLALPRRSRR